MTLVRRAAHLLLTLARELADENGYRRHLHASGKPHSAEEWRCYSDQKNRRKFQNAKCC